MPARKELSALKEGELLNWAAESSLARAGVLTVKSLGMSFVDTTAVAQVPEFGCLFDCTLGPFAAQQNGLTTTASTHGPFNRICNS